MRWFSFFWGLVLLASTFALARLLTHNDEVATFAVIVLSFNYYFVAASSTGRMDCMATALAFSGLAVFLFLNRKGEKDAAILASNSLIALAVLTHPNAILLVPLIILLLILNRLLTIRAIALMSVPYLIAGGLWATYIARDPVAFMCQFTTNLGHRLNDSVTPLGAIGRELGRYDLSGHFSTGSDYVKALIGLHLLVSGLVVGIIPRLRRKNGTLLFCLITLWLLMTLLVGRRWEGYLVNILPLYAICVAVVVICLYPKFTRPLLVLICILNVVLIAREANLNALTNHYKPVISFLRTAIPPTAHVTGAPQLGFGIGFDRLHDDPTLGRRTIPPPDYIVYDDIYYGSVLDNRQYPVLFAHVHKVLALARKVYDYGGFRVYQCSQECKEAVADFPKN